jgi:hypothetical protein
LMPEIPAVLVSSPEPAAAAAAAHAVEASGLAGAAPVAASAPERAQHGSETLPKSSSFTMHLRKCYLPGRIYHVLPAALPPRQARCGGLWHSQPPSGTIVYPSAQETFLEIAVAKSMFKDHLPHCYDLDDLPVPPEFVEVRDDQEPAAVSPVVVQVDEPERRALAI